MHYEILSHNQEELLPYLKQFNRTFYLVGGTAIALYLGHRRSIDFDLFANSTLKKAGIKSKLNSIPFEQRLIFEDIDQLHLMVHETKVTFFSFPFSIEHNQKVKDLINMPSLLDLSSMKAFALGRRAKWKDYVDLYYILKYHLSFSEIVVAAIRNFGYQFSEKLFREQLAFHKDIDYSEPVDFLVPSVSEEEIRAFLIDKAIDLE
jgi:hypothetical protein